MSPNSSNIPINLAPALNITVLNKHYPAATKEWYNSIYSYNKNSSFIFSPTYSSSIYNTFNSYLNMKPKSIKESWNRLSSMNTFIGRPEIKHDANKITFTIYNYNRQKTYYINKLKKFVNIYRRKLNSDNDFMPLIQSENESESESEIFIGDYQNIIPESPNTQNDVELATLTPSLVTDNMLYNNIKNNPISIFWIYFNNSFSSVTSKYEQDLKKTIEKHNLGVEYTSPRVYGQAHSLCEIKESFFDSSNVKTFKKELSYQYSSSMIYMDFYKYNNNNLLSLKNIIKKIYNKKVKMNIVSLKHIYLDSNIFAEAITRKLKDRQKRILHVLKMSLSLAKKPQFKMHFYKNSKIETSPYSILLDQNLNHNIDCLHNINNKYMILKPSNYKSRLLLYHIRHKIINGIRLQGTGRLTRRLTASRSISKVKYMGSLKNTYSSYENIFTVMLRGFMKSNVQYININNNNRNGAFGVKVSISSY